LTKTLWTIQILLAALFIFSGGIKLVMPIEDMIKQMPVALPGWFLQFIGVCELLGGIGMILPGLLRIKPGLTPLAAAGLVIIMIGATVINMMGPSIGTTLLTVVVGLLAAFVAYGRWRLAPIAARA
jgi:uncharacterized membrane protein YphA (DoxX/SURF4 family)